MSSVPGLAGLAVAGIFSGSLSTVSSAINSLAGDSDDDDDDNDDDDYNDDYDGSRDPGGLHPALLQQHVRQQGGGAGTGKSSISSLLSICYQFIHYALHCTVQVLTLIFGAACVGLAFLADVLGTGVLQASLTIFGNNNVDIIP